MAKRTKTSWKAENPITQLLNSADKATHAVNQAATHPSQQMIQQAQSAIAHTENGVGDALQFRENQEPIHGAQEQLDQVRQQLQQVEPIVDER